MTKSPSPTLAFLLALGGAVGAPAQDGALYSIVLDNPSEGDEARRAVSGDFDGDLRRDVVVLVDGLPTILWAPAVYGWSEELDEIGTVNDVDAVPSASGPDTLVTVSSAGLVEWAWSSSTGAFVSTNHASGSNWTGATAVRVADLDGNAPLDFTGIASGGTSFCHLVRNGTTSTAAKTSLSLIGTAIEAIEPVRWLSTGVDQVAVATDSELIVAEPGTGALATFTSGAGSDPALVAVELSGTSREGVAWSREVSSSSNLVGLVKHSSLGPSEPARDLSYFTARGIASGDLDGDGDGDLFAAGSFSPYGLFMGQVPPSPAGSDSSFSVTPPNSWAVLLGNVSDAGDRPGALIADLDGDGDLDALGTVEDATVATVGVTIKNSTLISETADRLEVDEEEFALLPGNTSISIRVDNLPATFGTHLEITTRRELDPSGYEVVYDTEIATTTQVSLYGVNRSETLSVTVPFGTPAFDPEEIDEEFAAVLIRVVDVDSQSGATIEARYERAFVVSVTEDDPEVEDDGVKMGPGDLPPVMPVRPPMGGG